MLTAKDIEGLREKIEKYRKQRRSENFIRRKVIDSVLATLGWADDDEVLVQEEYSVGRGHVDYALLGKEGNPAVLVEAKRLGRALWGEVQLQDYTRAHIKSEGASGYAFSVLTDGRTWLFYPASYVDAPADAESDEPGAIPCSLAVDLLEDAAEECCERLTRHLSLESVQDGRAKEALDALPPVPVSVAPPAASVTGSKQVQKHGPRTIFRAYYKGFRLERGRGQGTDTFLELLDMIIEDHGEEKFLEACRDADWEGEDPGGIEDRINWKGVTSWASIWIYFMNRHKVEHLERLGRALGIAIKAECITPEEALDYSSPTEEHARFKLRYDDEEYTGGAREFGDALVKVLAPVVAWQGGDKVVEACERANLYYYRHLWIVPSSEKVKRKRQYGCVDIGDSGYKFMSALNPLAKGRYLNRLAQELGIEGQLQCEVVMPPSGSDD